MMKNRFFHLFILAAVLMIFPMMSHAKTGWVSDMLILTFRQGPGNNFAVEKTLVSNTRVNIIGEENGFFNVELTSGDKGWVDKKFIIFEPPKAILLEQALKQNKLLEDRLQKLTGEIQTREEKLTAAQTDHSNQLAPLQASLKQVESENKQIRQELDLANKRYRTLIEQSKNIQQIVNQNKQLTEENKSLSTRLESVTSKNRNMLKTAMIKWFLAGVGVLLLGWVIGQSVSSKRRGYGSLLD